MTARKYRYSTLGIAVVLGGFLAWAIIAGQPIWIPFAGIAAAVLLKYFFRRSTHETLADERLISIHYRAVSVTYRIFTIFIAILGFVFILLRNSLPEEFSIIGGTLAFSACAIMLIHLSLYYYFAARS
jgi:uncharacterized membrane protein